jgi:tetratricopeptide (TPR) repeat protein
MAASDEIRAAARKAYTNGENVAAALLYRQLYEHSMARNDVAVGYQAIVSEADCRIKIGDIQIARSHLLEALQIERDHSEAIFADSWRWALRMHMCAIRLERPLSISDIYSFIAEIDSEQELSGYPHDTAIQRAWALFQQGRWQQVVEEIERAFTLYKPGGYVLQKPAWKAAIASIKLRKWDAAEEWIEAIGHAHESDGEWENYGVQLQSRGKLELARATGAPFNELRSLAIEVSAIPGTIDDDRPLRTAGLLRVSLLDRSEGDPLDPGHAAMRVLQRPPRYRNPGEMFAHRLLMADWYLAGVRFAADMPPCDDEYHEQPPIGEIASERKSEVRRRIHRAALAIRGAFTRARSLDDIFECEFRTRDVERRAAALAAIKAAICR